MKKILEKLFFGAKDLRDFNWKRCEKYEGCESEKRLTALFKRWRWLKQPEKRPKVHKSIRAQVETAKLATEKNTEILI